MVNGGVPGTVATRCRCADAIGRPRGQGVILTGQYGDPIWISRPLSNRGLNPPAFHLSPVQAPWRSAGSALASAVLDAGVWLRSAILVFLFTRFMLSLHRAWKESLHEVIPG